MADAWVVGFTEGGDYESSADDTPLAVCFTEERAEEVKAEYEAVLAKVLAAFGVYGEQIKVWENENPMPEYEQPQYLPVPKMPQKTKKNPIREADRVRLRAEINRITATNQEMGRKAHEKQQAWMVAWRAERDRLLLAAGLDSDELKEFERYCYPRAYNNRIERNYYILQLPVK